MLYDQTSFTRDFELAAKELTEGREPVGLKCDSKEGYVPVFGILIIG